MFQETSLPVPRGGGELGRALVTYPRSPYPSAPIEVQLPSRARSLENESTTKSKYKPKSKPLYRLPNLPHTFSPLGLSFLTPVTESASASASAHLNAKPKSTPAPLDLEMQFWESVTLEEASEVESAYVTASSSLGASADVLSPSPAPSVNLMFGSKEGGVWSPRVPAWNVNLRGADIGCILSPSQRKAFRKGMVASPSPNDPFAAFPSFTVAMMSGVVDIAVPPRARVAREV
ncbi:hypothetical protein J132_01501 [Termitomyces sp. J132]|nr:hypothetical protein J132_01501 [Termitomyces sp. J132]